MRYNFYKKIISALFLSALLMPAFALAENSATPTPTANIGTGICARMGDFASTTLSAVNDRQTKFTSGFNSQVKQATAQEASRDAKLESARTKADAALTKVITALEAKAKTDAEKQAILNFQSTIEDARSARRGAIDSAVAAFRTALDSAVSDRDASSTVIFTDFKTSVNFALQKAETDCDSGTSPSAISTTLKTSLQDAQSSLKTFKTSQNQLGTIIQALSDARKNAITKADSDYKTAAAKAETSFSSLFPNAVATSTKAKN